MLRGTGVSLGIKPGKGYSVTVPVTGELPKSAIVDASLHMGLVPMGNRLRIGGVAEFAGMDKTFYPHYLQGAFAGVEQTLPTVAPHMQKESATTWTGFRPITADGIPYIGPCRVQGLYINAGHTHLGWTMSEGAAHMLSDIMDGKTAAIDPQPYRPER
jgi:D-amino-acid dehydrogenase